MVESCISNQIKKKKKKAEGDILWHQLHPILWVHLPQSCRTRPWPLPRTGPNTRTSHPESRWGEPSASEASRFVPEAPDSEHLLRVVVGNYQARSCSTCCKSTEQKKLLCEGVLRCCGGERRRTLEWLSGQSFFHQM